MNSSEVTVRFPKRKESVRLYLPELINFYETSAPMLAVIWNTVSNLVPVLRPNSLPSIPLGTVLRAENLIKILIGVVPFVQHN